MRKRRPKERRKCVFEEPKGKEPDPRRVSKDELGEAARPEQVSQ